MKSKLHLMFIEFSKGLNKLNNFLVVDLSRIYLMFVKIDCIAMIKDLIDLQVKVQWH